MKEMMKDESYPEMPVDHWQSTQSIGRATWVAIFQQVKKKKVQKLHVYKAHFGWVSKIIQHCIGFALLRSVIGTEISRYFINQSYAKLKPIAIATQPIAFSSASSVLYLQLFRRSLKSFTDHGEHVISNIVLGCFC